MTVLNYLPYNYVPTEWVCILFITIYALSTFVHVVQAFYFRLWWLLPTAALCGIIEIIGWSGRFWSSQSPYEETPFLIQCVLVMGISFDYHHGTHIPYRGQLYHLSKNHKAVGSAVLSPWPQDVLNILSRMRHHCPHYPSSRRWNRVRHKASFGGHIALGGIAIQLLVLILYTTLAAEFLSRYESDRPMRRIREKGVVLPRGRVDRSMKRMLIGMSAMIILLLIRSVYRMVELSGGWRGKVIAIEWLFDVFDAGAIALAMITLSVFHPGVLLPGPDKVESPISHEFKDMEYE